jgi:hypothetical protein
MSSSITSLPPGSEVSGSVPAGGARGPPWRLAVLRSIAAAHFLAGTLEFFKVTGNLLLRRP